MLHYGLYEQVINRCITGELHRHPDGVPQVRSIDKAEAAKILARYAGDAIEEILNSLDEKADLRRQVDLVNQVIREALRRAGTADRDGLFIDMRAEQLLALISKKDGRYVLHGERLEVDRPQTSLAQGSLFTGAVREPSLFSELNREILSCNGIDLLVSFIKWTGLRLIMDNLKGFTADGGQLRVITTSYMGATDVKAIDELIRLPNTLIKVSYDTKRTRLHAKTYVFHRETGFTTAYVGSSNLSNAAMSSGLEWNVKVTAKEQPETIRKIEATFESYWNSAEFEDYTRDQQPRLARALKDERRSAFDSGRRFAFNIQPYPFQQEILDRLQAEREIRGSFRNLVVAATGTGKTVVSAFDYKRFCREAAGRPCRLLFIAHREEILRQSLECFRAVLKDPNFGELFVGGSKPEGIDHLFMSIQTLNSQRWWEATSPDFYDFIVADEIHHGAAPSYEPPLTYYQPRILLGLTATPERMDGKSILRFFNGRIASEIRLPEAIDRKLLCPFQYFGVTDTVDLSRLKWSRGGYDISELEGVYALNRAVADRRAGMVAESVIKYATDPDEIRGIGFCVSVRHAEYMAEFFSASGLPSACVTGATNEEERRSAAGRLKRGEIRFLFAVDIYNEGVDIPEINTVLFLRPTESLTVFLQQLGRGLRLAEDKECLTVLDFIGQANRKYNFEEKFAALRTISARSVEKEIREGFSSLPKGCHIALEKVAAKYVLDNIRSALNQAQGLTDRVRTFQEDSGLPLTLQNFLAYYRLEPKDIYGKGVTLTELRRRAGFPVAADEAMEKTMAGALRRFCAADSRRWLRFLLDALDGPEVPAPGVFSGFETRMLRMFQFTVWQKSHEECGFKDMMEGLERIRGSGEYCAELLALLKYNLDRVDFVDEPVDLGFDCPLDLHCSYSRDQLLVAMDYLQPGSMQSGVLWLPEKGLDVLLVTTNKSEKQYSPTTMYKDYSVSETLFHWQSQNATAEDSPTGQRYIHHAQRGSRVALFVRESKNSPLGAAPYSYLGLADHVQHEGSRPMSILWRLRRPIPARLVRRTSNLAV